MSKKLKPIRTPFYQQLRHFRYQALPILFFMGACWATVSLWDTQRNQVWTTGEVYAISVDLAADQAGRLAMMDSADASPALFTYVNEGDIVAQLDSTITQESIRALRSELASLKAQLLAEAAKLQVDRDERREERSIDARRFALDVERQELDLLDRRARLQTDRIELMQMQAELEVFRAAHAAGVETDYALNNSEHLRDAALERVEGEETAIAQALEQLKRARQRLETYAGTEAVDYQIETIIEPIRHQIEAHSSQIRQLELQQQALAIRSPIAGKITAIWRRGGQAVQPGEPIVTVTAVSSQEVVSYLREGQNYRPKIDDEVQIRLRGARREIIKAKVVRIGARVEQIPSHQLHNAQHMEWGLPVSIAVPPTTNLLPGQLVDVTFPRAE